MSDKGNSLQEARLIIAEVSDGLCDECLSLCVPTAFAAILHMARKQDATSRAIEEKSSFILKVNEKDNHYMVAVDPFFLVNFIIDADAPSMWEESGEDLDYNDETRGE